MGVRRRPRLPGALLLRGDPSRHQLRDLCDDALSSFIPEIDPHGWLLSLFSVEDSSLSRRRTGEETTVSRNCRIGIWGGFGRNFERDYFLQRCSAGFAEPVPGVSPAGRGRANGTAYLSTGAAVGEGDSRGSP